MRTVKICAGVGIAIALCLSLSAWSLQDWFRELGIKNFAIVDNGKIYRSGLPTVNQLDYLCEEYNITTVISLSGDVTEKYRSLNRFMDNRRIKHVNLAMMTEVRPPQQKITTFLQEIADSNNWPILVHCGAGVDRTGMMIALHRMVNEGWQWDRAREEAVNYGFHDKDKEKGPLLETMPAIASAIIASNQQTAAVRL